MHAQTTRQRVRLTSRRGQGRGARGRDVRARIATDVVGAKAFGDPKALLSSTADPSITSEGAGLSSVDGDRAAAGARTTRLRERDSRRPGSARLSGFREGGE